MVLIIVAVIVIDWLLPNKRIDLISSIYFGFLVGLLLTYVISLVIDPIFQPTTADAELADKFSRTKTRILIPVAIILCYLCISLLWQTKDEFRFIIPYVEFSKETKGSKPYILDTSVVIDGRIADVIETGIIDNRVLMPRFVLNELQNIADSSDKMRRSRGRRGLDVLNRLRNSSKIDFLIYERELPEMQGEAVDQKLLILAKHLNGKVVTGDFNLNKVAKLQNVPVINLNEVANSLKPVFLPGDRINILVVKPGEDPAQGIGYLDDGTMVVVEDGRDYIGQHIEIAVTSLLQTNAGRMVFGRHDATKNK
ncbi:MAG TPA: TRAM domain-containing protein [Pirellulaceae bacterium]|nr:TRAM domain-containing protein [Pirellulaceae bacterium]HMP67732.1 TRAM domain-containing protein [Pirellulaceae bacterium]